MVGKTSRFFIWTSRRARNRIPHSSGTGSLNAFSLNRRNLLGNETELAADLVLDRLAGRGIVLQELLDVLAPLAETLAAEREPRSALLDDLPIDGEIEQVPFLRDPLAVHHVELRFAERRRDLVLDDLHPRAAADDDVAVLDGADAADVDTHRGVELQRAATSRRFRVAEHDADLLAQLIDEDQARLGLGDDAGQLAKGLRHQPRLEAHLRFTHLSLDFGARHERGDRVDDDHVDAAGADEHFDDFERLLAVVRLRDEEVFELHAELAGVLRVERVLGVDEGRHPAGLLRLRDDLERERGLARRLGPEDLDHAAAGDATNAEGIVEADCAGGNRGHLRDDLLAAEAHDRALAELLFNLADGQLDGLCALAVVTVVICRCCHEAPRKKNRPSIRSLGAGVQACQAKIDFVVSLGAYVSCSCRHVSLSPLEQKCAETAYSHRVTEWVN